ncbi:MAG: dephospho-CoA kinase [Actinobacteria bacterium]|nr:dephospho-CoA kinase [Actinomycetota bacterium]
MNAGHVHVVGLTGNLGAGKSTVAWLLRELGARVIDADVIVRGLLADDAELQAAIRARFGPTVFAGPQVDRAALAARVFASASELATLERIVYPRLARETARLLETPADAPLTFLEAIKVVEGPNGDRLDALWVVESDPASQLQRAVARGMRLADAEARLAVQTGVDAKVTAFARRRPGRPVWRIANRGTLADLRDAVRTAWEATRAALR